MKEMLGVDAFSDILPCSWLEVLQLQYYTKDESSGPDPTLLQVSLLDDRTRPHDLAAWATCGRKKRTRGLLISKDFHFQCQARRMIVSGPRSNIITVPELLGHYFLRSCKQIFFPVGRQTGQFPRRDGSLGFSPKPPLRRRGCTDIERCPKSHFLTYSSHARASPP
jgi:hypothetical protein